MIKQCVSCLCVTPIAFALVLAGTVLGTAASAGVISGDLQAALQAAGPEQEIPVIITLHDTLDLEQPREGDRSLQRQALVSSLQRHAATSQKPVQAFLARNRAKRMVSLWLINGLAVTLKAEVIHELQWLPEVAGIKLDLVVPLAKETPAATAKAGWNLRAINAPRMWKLGHKGQGVVVASMDSGVDLEHKALKSKWRGGTNSWFDPYGQHDSPFDSDGHGTQTLGLIVAGAADGTAIGVAPRAQWIAVKIFDDAGVATLSGIHQGYQWLLDPDQDPATDDAAHIVNNSWGLKDQADQCIDEFEQDIRALRRAGIAVVFAAGNDGPNNGAPYPASSVSPANNRGAFAVGAVARSLKIGATSSRGPAACDGSTYPQVVAPGVSVRTTDLALSGAAQYTSVSGTSYAAAHVSGAMALLLSADPSLPLPRLERMLKSTARDLGKARADNVYGYGLIDVFAAYQALPK